MSFSVCVTCVQIKVLTAEYRHEMEHVENTFMLERDELLKAAKSVCMHAGTMFDPVSSLSVFGTQEWDAAMKARRDHELKSIEDAHKRVEEREKQLEHLRINDSEEYNIIKKKLEDGETKHMSHFYISFLLHSVCL